jgi:rhodanese-related sulfurtransferase
MKEISALELMTIYRTVSVVDVREPDEYVGGHIAGAVNIPLSLDQEHDKCNAVETQSKSQL